MTSLDEIRTAVISGNSAAVKKMVEESLAAGLKPESLIDDAMIPAMAEVGEKFKNNEIYVPEMLVAARAMYAGLDILKPLLADSGVPRIGKAVIGTVRGDLHDIGKNLVKMMMEGGGFDVVDLGTDVPPEKFVSAVKAEKPTHLCMSALLTTTMKGMKETISALSSEGLRNNVKVMVGGAPVTSRFAAEAGADGYAPDAGSAVEMAKKLMETD